MTDLAHELLMFLIVHSPWQGIDARHVVNRGAVVSYRGVS